MNYYFQWGDPEKTFLRRSDASIGKTTDVTNNRVTFIPLVDMLKFFSESICLSRDFPLKFSSQYDCSESGALSNATSPATNLAVG